MSIQEIVSQVQRSQAEHVVITGGEPMLPREIVELTTAFKQEGKFITIETAGTVYRKVECDLMSISPKLSNSTPDLDRAGEWHRKHESTRNQPEVINQLINRFDYQLKYVVAEMSDVDEIRAHLSSLTQWEPGQVWLMPEGIDATELERKRVWLEPKCDELGFQFCPRMHIQWYGNQRGT